MVCSDTYVKHIRLDVSIIDSSLFFRHFNFTLSIVLILWNQTSPKSRKNTKKNPLSNVFRVAQFSISTTINFTVLGFYFRQLTVNFYSSYLLKKIKITLDEHVQRAIYHNGSPV